MSACFVQINHWSFGGGVLIPWVHTVFEVLGNNGTPEEAF